MAKKMTRTSTSLFVVALTSILGVVFGVNVANADFSMTQNNSASSTVIGVNTITDMTVPLPNLPMISPSVGSFQVKINPAGNFFETRIFECSTDYASTSQIYSFCSQKYASDTDAHGLGFYTYVIDPPISLNSAKFYFLDFQRDGSNVDTTIFGADSSYTAIASYSPVTAFSTPAPWDAGGGFIPYFLIGTSASDTSPFNILPISNAGVQSKCSLTDISACVVNALAWAFVPGVDMGQKFSDLMDSTKDHAPFGYFSSAAAAVGSFSTTSTSSMLTIPAPLMTFIFTPLRVALVVIVDVAGLIWLYKRLTNIQI